MTNESSNIAKSVNKRSGGAAAAVGIGILFSRVFGLIRQRVFAHYLGNSNAAGAFMAALRIPNLLQNLFGEGVLSASFVPVYARLIAEGKPEEAGRVAGIILSLLTLVVGTLVALGVTFSADMITLLAPGFSGEVKDLTIRLCAIMFPGMGLLVLSAWCLGILNSHRNFLLSYLAPVVWNIAMIATLFAFGHREDLIIRVAWGSVIGALGQLLVQVPSALKLNRGLKLSIDLSLEPVKTVIQNFFPALLTRGVVQISAYIDQILASFLGPQAVAAMAYAQTLSILPVSLFGISISTSELTEMSRTLGNETEILNQVKERLVAGLKRLSFFIIPCSVAFVLLGGVLSSTLFQTGKFGSEDSNLVWAILVGSTVGLLASTQSRICISAFWAMKDTKTPARFAFIRVFLTAVLGYLVVFPLREYFGWDGAYSIAGLTASAGISGWIEYLLIKNALQSKLGAFHSDKETSMKCWGAAILSGAMAFGTDKLLPPTHPFIFGVVVIGVYGVLYLTLTHLFKVSESSTAIAYAKRRIGIK